MVATWDTRRSRRRSRRRGETSQSRNSSSFASWKWLRSAISRRGFATTRTTPRDDRFVTRGCSRCFSRFCDAPIPGFRSGAYRRCATYSPSRWRRAPPRIRRISSARSWIGSPRSPSPPRTSLGPQRTRRTNTQTRKNQKKPRARLFANDWRRAWNCARRTPSPRDISEHRFVFFATPPSGWRVVVFCFGPSAPPRVARGPPRTLTSPATTARVRHRAPVRYRFAVRRRGLPAGAGTRSPRGCAWRRFPRTARVASRSSRCEPPRGSAWRRN